MSKTYKSYDEDLKKEIVNLYESGKGISDLSREYGVGKSVISSWIKKYKTITISTGETANNDEILKLQKRNRELEQGFIILYFVITFIGLLCIFRTPKYTSEYENRSLQRFVTLTIDDFLNKTFQDSFENAMKDQFWLGEKIKKGNNKLKNLLSSQPINKKICTNNYVKVVGNAYNFNCGDYLVSKYFDVSTATINSIKGMIDSYDKMNQYTELFYYFVNRSSNFDFIANKRTFDISDYLDKNYDELKFNNYEEYTNYFYKTDHHWNYKGADQAYRDSIKLMLGENEKLLDVKETKVFNTIFYGSSARTNTFTEYKENFTVYIYDVPEHKEYINKNLQSYGNEELYKEGNYSKYLWANHYGTYYGGDNAEVTYDFNNESKENLLIFSNSFSNAVNKLIASHFNKTYIIDLRHYTETFGEEFDYKSYIEKNKIDKVLIICDINYLVSEEFKLEGEF